MENLTASVKTLLNAFYGVEKTCTHLGVREDGLTEKLYQYCKKCKDELFDILRVKPTEES